MAHPDRIRPNTSTGARIGLLGGSFNPAHEGHLQISEIALRRLNLTQVWWLVSPQNPLKSDQDMAPFEARLKGAEALARHPRIHVSDWESRHQTRFTFDTVSAIKRRHPHVDFVWLMGGDNLQEFHKWRDWQKLMRALPIAVIARPGYIRAALSSPAARAFDAARISPDDARFLATLEPPAWVFLQEQLSPLSSTAIRRKQRTQ